MKHTKNIVIAGLLIALITMSIGYAAVAQQLDIAGSAAITGKWKVAITGIESETTGTASAGVPSFTPSTVTFAASLKKPGDSVDYTITVTNSGNINAKLSNISLQPQSVEDSTADIIYEIVSQPALNSVLEAGDSTTVVVRITFDENATTVTESASRSFVGVLEYVQAED